MRRKQLCLLWLLSFETGSQTQGKSKYCAPSPSNYTHPDHGCLKHIHGLIKGKIKAGGP